MSAPNTIPMAVLAQALAALTVADKSMRDGPVQQWLIVLDARCALQAAMHGMQPVQVEGGAA